MYLFAFSPVDAKGIAIRIAGIFFRRTSHIVHHKKMPPEKPRISSVFLVLSPFSSLFQKSTFRANKKMPNAVFTHEGGFGLPNKILYDTAIKIQFATLYE